MRGSTVFHDISAWQTDRWICFVDLIPYKVQHFLHIVTLIQIQIYHQVFQAMDGKQSKLVTEKFRYPHFFQSYAKVQFADTCKIRKSESSMHHLSCTSRFGMIDGDSSMVYVACPLRPTHLRLALFATTVLQRPAPRFRPSSLRLPEAPLWSLQTSQLEEICIHTGCILEAT